MAREPQRAHLAELLGVERDCCTRLERIVAEAQQDGSPFEGVRLTMLDGLATPGFAA